MEQANASRVRNSWTDSLRGNLNRLADGKSATWSSLVLQAPVREMSAPLWAYFLKSEKLLRFTIPTLIVLLLAFVAATRASSLMTLSETLEQRAQTQLTLLSNLAAQTLALNENIETAMKSPTLSSIVLKDAVEQLPISDGTTVFLLDKANKVVAAHPTESKLLGVTLQRLAGKDVGANISKDAPEFLYLNLDGKTPVLARIKDIQAPANAKIGKVFVSQTEDAIYSAWNQQARLNIVLFIATSSVLLVILYAYFAQGARVRDTNAATMETNARFDTALLRGHCGLWDWDVSRGRIVWSCSMYEMLGMEPTGRVMGFGEMTQLLHPDDQDMMALANRAFEADQREIDHRFRMIHSSGQWVWLRLRAELVRYKGSAPHLIGIAVDISEQEAIRQRSRDADIRLRDAIENISEAFVLWDSKKRMVMSNTKYQQLYNLPASAVTSGAHYDDVMNKSRKPLAQRLIPTENKLDNGTQNLEAQIEDGRWLQISERRTRDGGFVSVGTDITQMKRNQQKLMESEQQHMATIAHLRSTQLESERRAQKLVEIAENLNEEKIRADAANKAKSDFLANISHELRTPLNAIIGFSDIMRAEMFGPLGSEKYDEYASDIHDSGNFLLGVINDVLDMSKIEAGRFQINPEAVQLNDLLEETLRIIQLQAEKANITVSQKIPKAMEVQADRRAIKQIMINLLSNAVKFTPEGGRVDVTAKALKDTINIVIKDNGIGISKEALKRLGQPFEQVQDQFTKNHKGSGLGLAIARSLAQLHGGTLKITSTLNKGTTVSVRLPISNEPLLDIDADDEFENCDEGIASETAA